MLNLKKRSVLTKFQLGIATAGVAAFTSFSMVCIDKASAATISSSNYSLTSIQGSYAFGQSDWNDVAGSGYVDNVADRSKVESLLSDGYSYVTPNFSSESGYPVNGIYNWSTNGLHALEFSFKNGADYLLDSLSFISTRSYGDFTPIRLEYSLDGGSWLTAAATTSGALGITTGLEHTYTLAFGGVRADAFRFITDGGEQVSLHEISIAGSPTAVPTPALLPGLIGLGFGVLRKRKAEAAKQTSEV